MKKLVYNICTSKDDDGDDTTAAAEYLQVISIRIK